MDNKEIKIGDAADLLGFTVQTLRNWDASGKLRARRSEGGTRYYVLEELKRFMRDLPALGWAWAASAQPPDLLPENYCERLDRFTSRLDKMATVMLQDSSGISEDMISLLVQVTGEIGDNSFVHNVGNWPDVLGIFYAYDIDKRIVVLADRGRGVRATLSRVRPNLETDAEALRVAFTEIISGRDPEKRGNGLKVVRRVAESGVLGLFFRSGVGVVQIPKQPGRMKIGTAAENVRGAYAVITF